MPIRAMSRCWFGIVDGRCGSANKAYVPRRHMALTLEEFIKDFTLEERAKLAARTARSMHATAAALRRNRRQTADNASYTAAY
jgi:hypothetical protein